MRLRQADSHLLALILGFGIAFSAGAPSSKLLHAATVGEMPLPLDALATGSRRLAVERARDIATATPALRRSPAAFATDLAVESLASLVVEQSHPQALRSAFEAYFNFRHANPDRVRKPYLYFVDYGLEATKPRGYVFDMEQLRIIEGPFTVAHGSGSAGRESPIPTAFSNRLGSNATSLGLYLTEETYAFSGKSGGRSYRSIGLRMEGLSGAFNSAARSRGVVVHGAPYVTREKAGRSEGCPAMEEKRAERLLPMLEGGSLVFHFSPVDDEWLRLEPWTRDELAYLPPPTVGW